MKSPGSPPPRVDIPREIVQTDPNRNEEATATPSQPEAVETLQRTQNAKDVAHRSDQVRERMLQELEQKFQGGTICVDQIRNAEINKLSQKVEVIRAETQLTGSNISEAVETRRADAIVCLESHTPSEIRRNLVETRLSATSSHLQG